MKQGIFLGLMVFLLVFISGCTGQTTVQNLDHITILYSANLENGTLVDDNNGRAFKFIVGSDQVIKGLSYGVLDMKVGETKTFVVSPKEGYGEYLPELVRVELITDLMDSNITPKKGSEIYAVLGENKVKGIVSDMNQTHATIDFNHALAGKPLIFKIEVVSIDQKSGSVFE